MIEPVPFVDASGSAYVCGRQHGAAVPARAKRSIQMRGIAGGAGKRRHEYGCKLLATIAKRIMAAAPLPAKNRVVARYGPNEQPRWPAQTAQ